MNKDQSHLWAGLSDEARNALTARDYKAGSLAQRIAYSGIDASELAAADRSRPEVKRAWIPGVEIFPRKIHSQHHRGVFGELGRRDEGVLAKIGFWPKQWSAARMFAQSAKGFHVHPPSIPPDTTAEKWLRRLFMRGPRNYSLRRYDDEQWDVMFFLQGRVEMILCDVRAGFSKRIMRFFIDGDNHRSSNNVGVVVPPGVAHAIRVEGSEDVIMVYGTSTVFHPEFEGRIASEIESAELPESWQKFLGRAIDPNRPRAVRVNRPYLNLMKRSFDPAILEMMDRPQPVSAELERDLERLRQLNRWFGSYRLVSLFMRRWIMPGAQMRVVDLATGSGDIPRLLVDHARKIGAQIEIDAVDQQPATLEIARRLSAEYPEISYHAANILEWDCPQGYDVALCSLVLHHFSDDDAVKLLRRCCALSKRFVLASDLRRGFLLRAGVYMLTALIFREPMTRFDARLSAERAFSFVEMRELAIQAGWKDFGHKKFRFARQAVWLE